MSPEQFAYWLQGCLETTEGNKLTEKQVQIIKDHLATVFTKVTPDRSKPEQKAETRIDPFDIQQEAKKWGAALGGSKIWCSLTGSSEAKSYWFAKPSVTLEDVLEGKDPGIFIC
jgi:hypothetical protein